MERPLMFHFPSFLYLTRPRPRGRWALLFISTTLFSPLFPRTAQLSAVRCAYQHTSRHTSFCVHASNGALTQFLPLQNNVFYTMHLIKIKLQARDKLVKILFPPRLVYRDFLSLFALFNNQSLYLLSFIVHNEHICCVWPLAWLCKRKKWSARN